MKKSGFTLIELIIVVVLIGILISLAVPNYLGKAERAKDKEAQTVLKLIQAAEKIYFMKHNGQYYSCVQAPCTAELNQNLNLDLPVNGANWDYAAGVANNFLAIVASRSDRSRTWIYSNDPQFPEIFCSGDGCP